MARHGRRHAIRVGEVGGEGEGGGEAGEDTVVFANATAAPTATATPVAAPVAECAEGKEAEDDGEEGEEEVRRLQELLDRADAELEQQRSTFLSLLGDQILADVEGDAVYRDVTTEEFRIKYLEHSAPLIRHISELRMERYKLAQQKERTQRRHAAAHMSAGEVWLHVQELEAEVSQLRAEVTALRRHNWEGDWELEKERVSDVVMDGSPRGTSWTSVWSANSQYVALFCPKQGPTDSRPPVWVWDVERNSLDAVYDDSADPCTPGKDRGSTPPAICWHPTRPWLAVLHVASNAPHAWEFCVWDASAKEMRPEFGRSATLPKTGAVTGFGWCRDDFLIVSAGGVLVSSFRLPENCHLYESPSPCGEFLLLRRNERNAPAATVCIFAAETQSVVYEYGLRGSHVSAGWDAHSRVLFSAPTNVAEPLTGPRHDHVLYCPRGQRVVRHWQDGFEFKSPRTFLRPPAFHISDSHPLWNMAYADGVAVDVDSEDLPVQVVPRTVIWGEHNHNMARAIQSNLNWNGHRRVEVHGRALRVYRR